MILSRAGTPTVRTISTTGAAATTNTVSGTQQLPIAHHRLQSDGGVPSAPLATRAGQSRRWPLLRASDRRHCGTAARQAAGPGGSYIVEITGQRRVAELTRKYLHGVCYNSAVLGPADRGRLRQ